MASSSRCAASVVIAIALCVSGCAQRTPARDHIQSVENGLLTAVVIQGETASPMKLTERMVYYGAPGVSIAVINEGKLDWAKGYGVLEAGGKTPVTTSTLFQAASISKPVTAMAALALVQRGRLNLDEEVNLRLKSWRLPENDFTKNEKVTLRRLLNHSAGTTVEDVGSYAAGEDADFAASARRSETSPLRTDSCRSGTWNSMAIFRRGIQRRPAVTHGCNGKVLRGTDAGTRSQQDRDEVEHISSATADRSGTVCGNWT